MHQRNVEIKPATQELPIILLGLGNKTNFRWGGYILRHFCVIKNNLFLYFLLLCETKCRIEYGLKNVTRIIFYFVSQRTELRAHVLFSTNRALLCFISENFEIAWISEIPRRGKWKKTLGQSPAIFRFK